MLVWLVTLFACTSDALPVLTDVDLGAVPVGGTLDLRLPLPTTGSVSTEGFEAELDGAALSLTWIPTSSDERATATVSLDDGRSFVVSAMAREMPAVLPTPFVVSQGYEPLDSVPETGLGDARLDGDAPVPFAIDPVTANAFFGDAGLGRAWRIDPFYNHASWGMWVAVLYSAATEWNPPPSCFQTDEGLYQDGTCTGDERDADGEIPAGWSYLHGGFAGDGELVGLTSLAADEARGRVWALGPGWLRAIDTDLRTTSDEGRDPYTFAQLVPAIDRELGEAWPAPWGGVAGDRLWLVDGQSGAVGWMPMPLDDGRPTVQIPAGWTDGARGAVGETLLFAAGARGVLALDAATGDRVWSAAMAQRSGPPIASSTLGDRAVFVWPDALLLAEDGVLALVPAPAGARFVGAAFDRIAGGDAETLELLVAAAATETGGWLAALSPSGAWLGPPLELAAPPRALGYGAQAHDLYVLYAAGAVGCDGALADHCDESGQHPAIVESWYNPYSLVPPTSQGHPLNLFLSPVVETPQDTDLDEDFSGQCGGMDALATACCALRWSAVERMEPNAAYIQGTWQVEGADTETTDDDPAVVWALNPSVLRLVRMCLEEPEFQASGQAMLEVLGTLAGPRSELAHLTHIGVDAPEEHLDWYLSLLYTEGVDYALPIDSQDEYAMLHQGLAAVFDASILGEEAPNLHATLGAGNGFDAETLVASGWADGSWVTAIRDGPGVVGQAPLHAFFFLSAGADPEIGTLTSRKKELWPLDLRQRAHVTGLAEDPSRIAEDDPSSGMLNLPGNTWQFGAIARISEAGAFRESWKAEGDIDAETWALNFRYLRRIIASSSPDRVKAWNQHILDVSSVTGLLTDNIVMSEEGDPNVLGLRQIQEQLIVPGYARWALPAEIVAEHEAAQSTTLSSSTR